VPDDPYPTSQYVLWAYRLLLGREPEDPGAVEAYPETSRLELINRFISSPEFRASGLEDVRPPHRRYMVELDNGLRFWLLSGDQYVSPAIATGDYESLETAFVRRYVNRGMAAVDVGANLGWFAIHLALVVGAEGRVDAFEPRSDLMDLLTKTIGENGLTNVTTHNFALGSQNSRGQMIWSVHDVNPGGTNLVSSEFVASDITAQPVAVRTLDACISHRVDFIKLDVEGSELLVFKGAERILAKDRPLILVEINPSNLMRTSGVSAIEFGQFVEKSGYWLYEITADGSCGPQIPSCELSTIETLVNVAMLPKERAESTAAIGAGRMTLRIR
jgi:FkbM family methyltransferase